MDFAVLAEAFDKMTQTSSRTELTAILVDVLKNTPNRLVSRVSYLTQGKLYPDFVGIEIGMAEKTTTKAIEKAFGANLKKIQELMRKTGDLGDVAAQLLLTREQQSFSTGKLTVENVYSALELIAKTSGSGSALTRLNMLSTLLNSASSLEAKFLIRFVTGKLRLGVADFTVLDALSIAFTGSKENRIRLEHAYNLTSDLGFVADLLANRGMEAVEEVKVTAGKPVRPMLAERMETAELIIEQMNGAASAEYKLDGERVQAHKTAEGDVTLFSRRLERITEQYSDVVEALESLPAKQFIVEGEAVAIDPNGKYLPFQELMHRRRKYDLKEAQEKYPVVLNLFDVLLIEKEPMIEKRYDERRKALEKLFRAAKTKHNMMLVPASEVKNGAEIDALMEESLAAGCEGLVVKDLASTYKAGARGYAWIKFKPEYRPNIRDTIDLVVVGANHGMGRRAGVYGAFLLAAYDETADIFRTTTKVGTGFSDLDLDKISKTLDNYKIPMKSPRVDARVEAEVWFEPKMVIEIIASEITLSPIYSAGLGMIREGAGFALRFPKFTGKIRDDKAPEDATTVQELLEMYQKQVRQLKKEELPSRP
ncbi:MAG TPA: ATP-dependent DNA ligase [Nitrososphaerales archaeon]|nr:ATP-dependent DNA ligase [Nitrososphaerales archaeon]